MYKHIVLAMCIDTWYAECGKLPSQRSDVFSHGLQGAGVVVGLATFDCSSDLSGKFQL